jgi:hypothetical protein
MVCFRNISINILHKDDDDDDDDDDTLHFTSHMFEVHIFANKKYLSINVKIKLRYVVKFITKYVIFVALMTAKLGLGTS